MGLCGLASLNRSSLAANCGVTTSHMCCIFGDWAPSTLWRHICVWRAWKSSCASVSWLAGAPNLGQLLDFLEGFSDGGLHDRGKHTGHSAVSILSAMGSAAYKFP